MYLQQPHHLAVVNSVLRVWVPSTSCFVLLRAKVDNHFVDQLQGDEEVALPLAKPGLVHGFGHERSQPEMTRTALEGRMRPWLGLRHNTLTPARPQRRHKNVVKRCTVMWEPSSAWLLAWQHPPSKNGNKLSKTVRGCPYSRAIKTVTHTTLLPYGNAFVFLPASPPPLPSPLVTFSVCVCVCMNAHMSTCARMGVVREEFIQYYDYNYLWGFNVYIFVDLVNCSVLTLVGELQCHRNDRCYYLSITAHTGWPPVWKNAAARWTNGSCMSNGCRWGWVGTRVAFQSHFPFFQVVFLLLFRLWLNLNTVLCV